MRWSLPSMQLVPKAKDFTEEHQYESVGIPMLGAGLGGLHADDVRPIIVDHALHMHCKRVIIFEPR